MAQDSFKDIPKTFKRVRPLLEKEELLKTNYSLGEEKTYYQSAHMGQFGNPTETNYN